MRIFSIPIIFCNTTSHGTQAVKRYNIISFIFPLFYISRTFHFSSLCVLYFFFEKLSFFRIWFGNTCCNNTINVYLGKSFLKIYIVFFTFKTIRTERKVNKGHSSCNHTIITYSLSSKERKREEKKEKC